MGREPDGSIERLRAVVSGQDTDSEFARLMGPCMDFGGGQQGAPNAVAAVGRQYYEIRYEGVVAGRVVELFVRHTRVYGNEPDDTTADVCHENCACVNVTSGLELVAIGAGHLGTGSEARVDGALEVLHLDDAASQGGHVGGFKGSNLWRHGCLIG